MIQLVFALLIAAPDQQTHTADKRVAYLEQALGAVRATSKETRDHAFEYARVLEQGACASGIERLKVDCLMTAARRYCKKKGPAEVKSCHLAMDVVISNVLAAKRFITMEHRYEIMKRFEDHRKQLAIEIRRTQGALAADFRMRTGEAKNDAELARNIDHYCMTTADDTDVAWQSCASSLVWFIATAGDRSAPGAETAAKRDP
jgi:hypothetical protein